MSELLYRLLLLFGLLLILPPAARYRIRSHSTGESLDRRQEGWSILIGLRVCALVHILGLFCYIFAPELILWAQLPLPDIARLMGVPIGLAGGALWLWTFEHLGPNLTDTVVTRKKAYLVTSGPYAHVRHPFYGAFLLATLANSLVSANPLLMLSGLAAYLLLVRRTDIEEKFLIARFGDEYRGYMRSTPRFFPRPFTRGLPKKFPNK